MPTKMLPGAKLMKGKERLTSYIITAYAEVLTLWSLRNIKIKRRALFHVLTNLDLVPYYFQYVHLDLDLYKSGHLSGVLSGPVLCLALSLFSDVVYISCSLELSPFFRVSCCFYFYEFQVLVKNQSL